MVPNGAVWYQLLPNGGAAHNIFCLLSKVFPKEFVLRDMRFLYQKMGQKIRYKMVLWILCVYMILYYASVEMSYS